MEEDLRKEQILYKLDNAIHDVRELKSAALHNVINNKDWESVIQFLVEIERDVKEY